MSVPTPGDADALISAHLDGELDDDGVRSLEAWLESDPANRRRFLRATIDHRTLHERLAHAPADGRQTPSAHVTAGGPSRASRPRRAAPRSAARFQLAASILLTVGTVIGLWMWQNGRNVSAPPTLTSTTTTSEGSAFDPSRYPRLTAAGAGTTVGSAANGASASKPTIGRLLVPGDLIVVDAIAEEPDGAATADATVAAAELTYADGTRVRLERGAQLQIDGPVDATSDAKRLTLHQGRVHADVSPQPAGHPMTIATAESEVTVVGTVLAVTSAGGETRAEVTRGTITMSRPLAPSDHAGEHLGGAHVVGVSQSISAGQYAIAASDGSLVVHAIGAPSGKVHAVGAGQPYATLAALPKLSPGDVVELQPGTYREARTWTESGTTLRPIVIRGVGGAPATIDGEGVDASGVGDVPRALFQILGSHVVIERLEFVNARNRENAAGIRTIGTTGTVIRRCRITRCDQGITADDADLLIEDCDVGWCGTPENDGHCHAIHAAGAEAVIRGCNIHDAMHGQALRATSRRIVLIANRISGAQDGEMTFASGMGAGVTTSGERDSLALLIGNLVTSLPDRGGNHRRFIELGQEEHAARRGGTLALINNTFVAGDPRVVFVSSEQGDASVHADNNIFVGSDHIVSPGSGKVTGRRNWLPPTAEEPAGFTIGVNRARDADATRLAFIDPAHGDYHLGRESMCIDAGLADPRFPHASRMRVVAVDVEPGDAGTVPRRQDGRPDVGAFEAE